jgi:hypothetical protein
MIDAALTSFYRSIDPALSRAEQDVHLEDANRQLADDRVFAAVQEKLLLTKPKFVQYDERSGRVGELLTTRRAKFHGAA